MHGARRLVRIAGLVLAFAACTLGPTSYELAIPPEVPHRLAHDQVADIARTEATARGYHQPQRPFRIRAIALVPPNREIEVVNVSGTELGGGIVSTTTTWAVEFEGRIDLGRQRCIDLAVLIIDDQTGAVRGLLPRGPEQRC